MKPIVALLAAALLAVFAAAPAVAAPVASGTVSAEQPKFAWSGGPLSGGNMIGEPCGTTHQCEDTLLHVKDDGELKIHWTASGPGDQGWMGVDIYKSDAEGNVAEDEEAVASGGAFDNEGALVAGDLKAGDYVVRFGALLSVAATYDADATLKTGHDPLAGPKGPKNPDASAPDWFTKAGAEWRQAPIEEEDGTTLHADVLRPAGMPVDQKTPVILSIGPYFNHSGQTDPTENPAGDKAGPSTRFVYR